VLGFDRCEESNQPLEVIEQQPPKLIPIRRTQSHVNVPTALHG
jgi:hypothetical protein